MRLLPPKSKLALWKPRKFCSCYAVGPKSSPVWEAERERRAERHRQVPFLVLWQRSCRRKHIFSAGLLSWISSSETQNPSAITHRRQVSCSFCHKNRQCAYYIFGGASLAQSALFVCCCDISLDRFDSAHFVVLRNKFIKANLLNLPNNI